MKTIWKAAIAALSFSALAGCQAGDGYYNDGYYGGGYYGGYCDSYGCPGNYWDMPVYYGSIYYGGSWLNGPFYYRDWNGRRQYWARGGWRYDGWSGDRPSQYRDFRYGPALGRDWYRNNGGGRDGRPGFQGRGNDNRPGFGGRDGGGRDGGGRDGGGRDGGSRGNRGAQQDQSGQQAQPPQNNNGGSFSGRGFQRMDAPRGSPDGRALTPPDRRFGRESAGAPPPRSDGGSGPRGGDRRGRGQ